MTSQPGSGQLSLFPPSQSPLVTLDPHHRLVLLTDQIDWVSLESAIQEVRMSKLKSRAGRRPQLRALIGAVILMATRRMTYREAEDQIRHYGPARYLCALTDGNWTPDHTTIQDFTELIGEEGMLVINEYVLKEAQRAGLLGEKTVVGDTTAQEAPMSYPTEVGLMYGFVRMAQRAAGAAGTTLRRLQRQLSKEFEEGERLTRKYRFFSKDKDDRIDAGKKLLGVVKKIRGKLAHGLKKTAASKSRLKASGKVARKKLEKLCDTMKKLAPQIKYWLDTGWVAKKKIVNLLLDDVCSIPRGKVGKDVEFGVKWGLTRFGGGFLHGQADPQKGNFNDKNHAVESVQDAIRLTGATPDSFAYDRGGYSPKNVERIEELGVTEVALAPTGRAEWPVSESVRRRLMRERTKIEGSLGALKSSRYSFNRPNVRSTEMMMTVGHRSVAGYNLNRWMQLLAKKDEFQLIAA